MADEQLVEEEVFEETETEDTQLEAEEETQEQESEETESDDEVVVTIGEPEEEQELKKDSGLVKHLRKVTRSLQGENKRLQRELEQRSTAANPPAIDPGPKPTMKGMGYREAEYEKAMETWYEKSRQKEQQEASQKQALEAQQQLAKQKHDAYQAKKVEHGFRDMEDAEQLVMNTLNQTQQAMILQGAKDPALLVYALGTNSEVLDELAKMDNIAEFANAVFNVERDAKVRKKKVPAPERRINSATQGGGTDATLDRLEEEAEKTGDRTKVWRYKRDKERKKLNG